MFIKIYFNFKKKYRKYEEIEEKTMRNKANLVGNTLESAKRVYLVIVFESFFERQFFKIIL